MLFPNSLLFAPARGEIEAKDGPAVNHCEESHMPSCDDHSGGVSKRERGESPEKFKGLFAFWGLEGDEFCTWIEGAED